MASQTVLAGVQAWQSSEPPVECRSMNGMALERLIEDYRHRRPLDAKREALVMAAREERANLMAAAKPVQLPAAIAVRAGFKAPAAFGRSTLDSPAAAVG
jgi:hypothetical protein